MSGRTVGVIGTIVWDRILGYGEEVVPVEDWGGVAYALAAFPVVLPEGWSVLPIVKVGSDLADETRAFLAGLPRTDASALTFVPEPNNRIELRYVTPASRKERLSGGVPGWSWEELEPLVARCDALYFNFISGFEVDVETALRLRAAFDGPIYADLHSLFLRESDGGHLVPCSLPDWARWLRCFDVAQMNETEAELLGEGEDPWSRAEAALGDGLKMLVVTLGERGAAYVASSGFEPGAPPWTAVVTAGRGHRRAQIVTVPTTPVEGDPTGCGDVFGTTTFSHLLAGQSVENAVGEGNRIGALNVEFRGAGGLHDHLSSVHGGD